MDYKTYVIGPCLTPVIHENAVVLFQPLLFTLYCCTLFQTGIYQCSSADPGVVKCGIGNPLLNTTGPLTLTFRESGNIFDSRFIYFSVHANSSSTELTPQDPLHFKVEVIKRAEISIRGWVQQ